MVKHKAERIKTYCESRIKQCFPSVRGAVLLIVVPAFFIVPIYFLSVVKEIVVDKRFGPGVSYEKRFADVRQDLPAHAPVNFISDHPDRSVDYLYVRYALVPTRIVRGLKPMHDLLIVQYLTTPGIPEFKGYQLLKNYGDGVLLYKRSTN